MARYVVLDHRPSPGRGLPRGAGPHFDWMFEVDGELWTWATDVLPAADQEVRITATRLVNHRIEYLEFTGPLSQDRGEVTRVEAGEYEALRANEDEFVCRVWGERCGELYLQRMRPASSSSVASDDWYWSFCPKRKEAN